MDSSTLLYIGSFLPFVWGVSHLFPTRNVVKGFGDISSDNRYIITMDYRRGCTHFYRCSRCSCNLC
jgi:hypothetical protein